MCESVNEALLVVVDVCCQCCRHFCCQFAYDVASWCEGVFEKSVTSGVIGHDVVVVAAATAVAAAATAVAAAATDVVVADAVVAAVFVVVIVGVDDVLALLILAFHHFLWEINCFGYC